MLPVIGRRMKVACPHDGERDRIGVTDADNMLVGVLRARFVKKLEDTSQDMFRLFESRNFVAIEIPAAPLHLLHRKTIERGMNFVQEFASRHRSIGGTQGMDDGGRFGRALHRAMVNGGDRLNGQGTPGGLSLLAPQFSQTETGQAPIIDLAGVVD